MIADSIVIRLLNKQDYSPCLRAMQQFAQQRSDRTQDEIWLLQHPPVFTLGQNGKSEHVLHAGDIPVILVDRGGQVTYHGPGQLVVYTLIDLKRKKLNIRDIVTLLEKSVIELLARYGIEATSKRQAPGVYIDDKKICSIGLRIRRGTSYHGLALNIDMDLSPFKQINPCGYQGLQMTQLAAFVPNISMEEIQLQLIHFLILNLRYTDSSIKVGLPDGNETNYLK